MLAGSSVTRKCPSSASYAVLPPAWAITELAGASPPETSSRSQLSFRAAPAPLAGASVAPATTLRPVASTTVHPDNSSIPWVPSRSAAGDGVSRRSATATISRPASWSASAAHTPRSVVVATTARSPGLTPYSAASRRARAREHDAGNVVPFEHERLLDSAGRVHVLAGSDLVQSVALPNGHETVEVTERRRAREDLDAGCADPLGQLAGRLVPTLPQQPAARLGSVVDHNYVGAELGRGERRGEAGVAAADDEHICVAPAVLRPPRPFGLVLG